MPEMTPSSLDSSLFKISNEHSEVTIHQHGATIISWKLSGQEQLFLSKKALLDGSKPIRGGIPLVFPQFGTGPIMKGQHGFARTLPWQVEASGCMAKCTLVSSAATMDMWNHEFKLVYTIALIGESLKTQLTVFNTGSSPFEFTALLHTYLRVESIDSVSVSGLQNVKYADKLKNGKLFAEDRDEIIISEETDRKYLNYPGKVLLKTSSSTCEITSDNFSDLVLWNPWIEKAKAMADFDDEEYKQMICLEVGKVGSSINLEPTQSWSGSQTLSVVRSKI